MLVVGHSRYTMHIKIINLYMYVPNKLGISSPHESGLCMRLECSCMGINGKVEVSRFLNFVGWQACIKLHSF